MNVKTSIVLVIVLCTLSHHLFAQNKKEQKLSSATASSQPKDNLNKVDNQNRKQGLWFYMHDARMGEPRYYEFGSYKDNKKTGIWTKLDQEQRLTATENYQNGVLNGTSQYYEAGKLYCIGNFRGLNQDQKFDSIMVTDPNTLEDSLVILPSEIGHTKHGIWRYYNVNNGHLIREEEYQVDNLIYEKDFVFLSKEDSARANLQHEQFLNKRRHEKAPKGKRSILK